MEMYATIYVLYERMGRCTRVRRVSVPSWRWVSSWWWCTYSWVWGWVSNDCSARLPYNSDAKVLHLHIGSGKARTYFSAFYHMMITVVSFLMLFSIWIIFLFHECRTIRWTEYIKGAEMGRKWEISSPDLKKGRDWRDSFLPWLWSWIQIHSWNGCYCVREKKEMKESTKSDGKICFCWPCRVAQGIEECIFRSIE